MRWPRKASISRDIAVGRALISRVTADNGKRSWHTARRSSSTTENPRNVGTLDKEGPQRGHRPRRRARLRRRDAAADPGEPTTGSSKTRSSRPSAAARPSRLRPWRRSGSRAAPSKRPRLKNTDIVEELNLPPVKIHCSVLAEDAIKSAIEDFRKRRAVAQRGACEARRGLKAWRVAQGSQSGAGVVGPAARPCRGSARAE
jgi:nitrogen fixation NifU-like protein